MKLYFTRHGESEANTRRIISNRNLPHALTQTGREQAAALAQGLSKKTIAHIYSSPIARARQTAEILSFKLKAPVECEHALREPDCGILEGRADQAAWEQHNYWKEAWLQGSELEHGPQGGETCIDVRRRLAEFIERLSNEYRNTDLEFVLVTHGALLLFGLPGLLKNVDHQFILDHGLDHTVLISAVFMDGYLVCQNWERFPGHKT